jgi:parallel beta-helix repeat protein
MKPFSSSRSAVALVSIFVGLFLYSAEVHAASEPVQCGVVLSQSAKLKSDLGPCQGDGLVIAASGIEVDLNGYKIFGLKRANIGVRLENVANVVVKGGTIDGFDTGVLISGGLGNTVYKIGARNNRFGIHIENAESSGHRIEKSLANENRLTGILLSQFVSGTKIVKNTVNNNAGQGIVLDSGSSMNVIEDNQALDNGGYGIELRAASNNVLRTISDPSALSVISPIKQEYLDGVDYHPAAGNGDLTARLVPIDIKLDEAASSLENPLPADTSTSGCELGDYSQAGFQPGDIALIQRGTCTLDTKIIVAEAAGAKGVILFNEGQIPDRTTHTFGTVGEPLCCGPIPFPVLSASYAVGFNLYGLARSGLVNVRISATTSTTIGRGTPATHNNFLTKNYATSALDENSQCGSNQWIKNVIESGSACPSGPPPTGLGATAHNY